MIRSPSAFSESALPDFTAQPVAQLTRVTADTDAQDAYRQHLRERFDSADADTMADEELLELILFRAIPKRDVKALAKLMIDTFGDFNRVMAAPRARLSEMPGISRSVIRELKIVEASAHRMARSQIMHREVLSSWDSLQSYCQTRMAHLDTEQFRVLYLDRKNVLMADEAQQVGTVDHVPVYPREVLKRGLELGASALILVHNHPSGDPTPSETDIETTRSIQNGAEALGLVLHDHLIVGKSRHYSFRSHGLL